MEVRYWPHPAQIPLIRAPPEIWHNVTNILKDDSKIGGKAGAAAIITKESFISLSSNYMRDVPIIRQNRWQS
jgi:hypothetical protein